MQTFKTNKILVELTEQELKRLLQALNTAEIRMAERNWPEKAIGEVRDLWIDLYEIQKGLPF